MGRRPLGLTRIGTNVNATANFLGLRASSGIVKKATKKQIIPPAMHARNPMNLEETMIGLRRGNRRRESEQEG